MSQYRTGTVLVTNASAAVVGTGTLFTGNVAPGNLFTIPGENVAYPVASVSSNTALLLAVPYQGVTGSGKSYVVHKSFAPFKGYPYPERGDVETALIVARAIIEIDEDLQGENWREIGAGGQPTFNTNWGNSASSSDETAGFFKDALGFVHLKGALVNGVDTAPSAMFTLPTGYRPAKLRSFSVVANTNGQGVVEVGADGVVTARAGTLTTMICLDGIRFRV